jgi:hypothetical protein
LRPSYNQNFEKQYPGGNPDGLTDDVATTKNKLCSVSFAFCAFLITSAVYGKNPPI